MISDMTHDTVYETAAENLAGSNADIYRISEIRAAHIDDAARKTAGRFTEPSDFFSNGDMISEYARARAELFKKAIPETAEVNRDFSSAVISACRNIEICELCRRIYSAVEEKFPLSKDCFFENDTGTYEKGLVAIVRNFLTEKAYAVLSERVSGLHKYVYADFKDVCDSVSSSFAEYCILPIENSDEGELSGFVKMSDDYGLKRCLTVSVFTGEERYTKFGVFRRGIAPVDCPDKDTLCLDILIAFHEREELTGFFSALQYMKAEAEIINSVPDSYHVRNEYRYKITLRMKKSALTGLLFWLCLEFPSFTPLGLYTRL